MKKSTACAVTLMAVALSACTPPPPACTPPSITLMGRCVRPCETPSGYCEEDGAPIASDGSSADAEAGIDAMADAREDTQSQPDAEAGIDAADAAPDVAACETGTSRCGDLCVATQTDLANCGVCGLRCPTAANAAATCNAGACGLRCNVGFHDCSGRCLPDNAPTSCGTMCAPCSAPAGAEATCTMGACGWRCLDGFDLVGGTTCEVRVARLVAPMSGSRVTTQRPTLRWSLPAGTDGAVVDICRRRDCMAADIVDTVTVTGTTARPTTALAAGTYFWRARARVGAMTAMRASATWMLVVPGRDSSIDSTSGFVADFNGDGYADTAIAAPAARSNRGVVFVYHGSSTGLGSTPTTTIEGLELNENFGQQAVSIGGDLNGDGYSDLLVSSRQSAYVFLGSATGLSVSPSAFFAGSIGYGAGDLDRDGYGDALIAQPEAMVGAVRGAGTVAEHRGSSIGLQMTSSRTLSGTVINEYFGDAVAAVGDVNGDGFSDVAISSTNARPGGFTGAGQSRVFHGGAAGLAAAAAWTGNGTAEFQHFGFALSGGDLNGDGYSDLVVGAPSSSATRAFAYFGGAAGVSTTASVTWNGNTSGDGFGTAVACGDTDRDGFADVLIGAPSGTPMQSGYAWMFRGAAMPMTSAVRTYTGNAMTRLGATVSVMGDCNGDGFDDIVISATDPTGVVRVHLGSAASVGVGVHQMYTGEAASGFGAKLAR